MKLKRFLSLFASAAIMATTVTTVTVPTVAAGTEPIPLFFDNFDSGYTNGISKHSDNNYTSLNGTEFETSNAIGVSKESNFFYSGSMERLGDGDKAFVLENNAGVGSGKALNVTTQAGLNSCSWMIKNSGINAENIRGKELTFTANFMIPEDNGFNRGNGVLVYLDKLGDATEDGTGQIMPSTRYQFAGSSEWEYQNQRMKNKTLLGIESEQYLYTPCIFAFGEKLEEIKIGTPYRYELTLTPNSAGTGYTAKATVNGNVHELTDKSTLPTVEEMAGYQFAMIGERANPYMIANSVAEGTLYQNDKTIALLDDLMFTASEPAAEGDIFYSDDFSGYTEQYIAKAEENKIEYYNTENYTLRNNVNSGNYTDKNEEKISAGDANHIAKLVDNKFASSSGKSLQLTSQGIVTYGSMYKLSNITEDKIKDKALVFNAKFKIPEDGIYNEGVGFAAGLSPVNAGNTAPDAVCGSRDFQIHEDHLKNKYKFFAANGFDFYVFDKKMDTLKKGETYSFTLKMVPDTENVKYRIYAKLNDYEVEVFSDDAPKVKEMAAYKYSFIALHNHGYYTYAYSLDNGTSNYTNDQPLVYMDDISFERKELSEVTMPKEDTPPTDTDLGPYGLFNEDFEDYKVNYVKKATSDELAQYEKNSFVLNYGAKTADPPSDQSNMNDGRIEKGDISKLYKISNNDSFGNGSKYLSIQSQGLTEGGTMWQRSNITSDRIKDKTLVFKTRFTIPSTSQWGNGRGAAIVLTDAPEAATKPNGSVGSVNMFADDLSSKYYLASVTYREGANRFEVFGENVGNVESGKPYEVTVTMVPNAEGKYTVTAKLNDTVKTLKGNEGNETVTIPTMAELGNYAFVGVISHANSYNTLVSFDNDTNKYLKDRDLIYFDDISLKRADAFVLKNISDLTSGNEIDMAKKCITLNLGEEIKTVDKTKITIDNGASVSSAEIDATNKTKLKITFNNLKLNTGYTINVAGVVNPIGVEYSDTLSLRTSAGVDVNWDDITLGNGTDGKKKVTVPVSKQEGVTDTVKPAVIVYVYDGSNTDAPLIKHAYAKEEEVTGSKNIEVTGIEVGAGDKVRVFVWDGFSSMKPLTQRKELN